LEGIRECAGFGGNRAAVERKKLAGWRGVVGKLLVDGQIPAKPPMHRPSAPHRALTCFLLLGFAFSLPGPLGLVQTVEAASASASARIIKALKKQVKTLKAQLEGATATPATPAAFVEMVKVGNAGNVADSTNFGAVPYEYSIGKYEVTLVRRGVVLQLAAQRTAERGADGSVDGERGLSAQWSDERRADDHAQQPRGEILDSERR
jgi:hypothetical protein